MKTFTSVAIGLLAGIVIGVVASFKVAEKKADETIRNELEEERSMQHKNADYCENGVVEEEPKSTDVVNEVKNTELEDVLDGYRPSKPYVLEDKPDGFKDSHPFLNDFIELNVVFDKNRGRVADEDGCEIFDIKGKLGLNNLNRLFSDEYSEKNIVHIVCENDGIVYVAHKGDLYEYLDEE